MAAARSPGGKTPTLAAYNVMSLGIWYETVMRWVGEATAVMAMGKTFVAMRRDLAQ